MDMHDGVFFSYWDLQRAQDCSSESRYRYFIMWSGCTLFSFDSLTLNELGDCMKTTTLDLTGIFGGRLEGMAMDVDSLGGVRNLQVDSRLGVRPRVDGEDLGGLNAFTTNI